MSEADFNAELPTDGALIFAVSERKPIDLANALEDGATRFTGIARELLLSCLRHTHPTIWIVHVRKVGGSGVPLRALEVPSDRDGDGLPESDMSYLIRGLRSGAIGFGIPPKPRGRPRLFFTKAILDGAAIEKIAADSGGIAVSGKGQPDLPRGTLTRAIAAFRLIDGKSKTELKPYSRYAERALAQWRKLVSRSRDPNGD